MIVKMKRYSFLVYHKQYNDFLEKIREVGVLHVIEKAEGIAENDALREKMQMASRVQNALTQLENLLPETNQGIEVSASRRTTVTIEEGLQLLQKIENINSKKELLTQKKQLLEREFERMSIWGNFDLHRIKELEKNGIKLHFFSCQLSKYLPEWDTLYQAFEIGVIGGTKYFAIVSNSDENISIDAEPVKLSDQNALELQHKIELINFDFRNLDQELKSIAELELESLKHFLISLESRIDLAKVLISTKREADEKVMLLEGYCPELVEKPLNELLENEGVYYTVSNPDIEENIPIQLKNNSFSKLFEPITNLFSLPNYGELDPTPFLAPFFMLFFGLCLGDGGYGIIIWAVATFAKRKAKPDMKGLLTLGQYLGLATVVVGIFTGSFLGIALDQVEWKWLAGVKHYFLTQDNYGDKLGGYNPMMIIAVIIGIIQILFGMIVNVIKVNKQHGFKHAVGHLAWVFFIISAIAYIGLQAINIVLPVVGTYALYAVMGISVLCILFYNSPGKSIFSNVGSALWNTYNMATGLLGDTLSYIRLFALGLTGSILGGVFNTLAFDLTSDINFVPGKWLAIFLILIVGHTINFALCLIGAFVHPLRLTFVEFYKNAGFEGGGKAYKPFKKQL